MPIFVIEEVTTTVIKSTINCENASLALAKAKTSNHGQVISYEVTENKEITVERYKEEN